MESDIYTIILSDGTTLENLYLNGNNFISDTLLTAANFEGKLDHITIECSDGTVNELDNVELVRIKQYENQYWFVLRQLTADELYKKQLEDTISLLTNCILEISEELYS